MVAPRILLGVSGSIAAYKAPEIARLLGKRGVSVQAALTKGASKFITPLTFQAITGQPVLTDIFALSTGGAKGEIEHVERAHEVDLVVIAPASANLIARLTAGMADDVLTATVLSTRAPLIIAPAMESGMWSNPATTHNIALLKKRGVTVVGPEAGELASGRSGMGRMVEPEVIVESAMAHFSAKELAGCTVLITAGPTWEPLDPVRLLTNRSTGSMGIALANAAADKGAQVRLVLGPTHLTAPMRPGLKTVRVESARSMLEASRAFLSEADVIIGAAAVSDYRPKDAKAQKLKRSDPRAQVLELEENPDILKTLAGEKKKGATVVGFAAETEALEKYARGKLVRKGCDMVVGNIVGKDKGFGAGETSVLVVYEDRAVPFGPASKTEVAKFILDQIAGSLEDSRTRVRTKVDERKS